MHRIKHDKRVNFKYDWKMLTIAIGGNDICSFICLMKDPDSLPEKHRVSLTKTLRYLKNNLPRFDSYCLCIGFACNWLEISRRTFVNIVSVPFVETVMLLKSKPRHCRFIHRGKIWRRQFPNQYHDSWAHFILFWSTMHIGLLKNLLLFLLRRMQLLGRNTLKCDTFKQRAVIR